MKKPQQHPDDLIETGDHEAAMPPAEFEAIRELLGWSQHRLAIWLGVSDQMVNGYIAGRFPIPLGRANHMRLTALCVAWSKEK